MGDPRDLLDRAAARLELRPHGWERMLELAHRRQRRRRLFAGVLALVLSASAGASLWTAFHGTTQTAGPSDQETVARLVRSISSTEAVLRQLRSELHKETAALRSARADLRGLQAQLATIDGRVDRARVQAQIQSESVHVEELRAHIRALHDELPAAAERLASLELRKADLTLPRSVYPAAASFPSWGNPGGCPSPDGVEQPEAGATAQILPHLSRLGTESFDTDLSLADRAYWPILQTTWSSGELPGRVRTLTPEGVVSGPAAESPYAGLVRGNCGRRTLDLSWWVAVCPVGTRPCSLRDAPALTEHFLLVDRRGSWLVWFAYP